ncbi:ubiquitin carboxyl-terminal hydrolase 48-like [Centruroides vittatus]|uniref:ubiquitin carboxyl-terminal hydrolase 48-like n=1 Tax=Centruroides vittatus TaxID=120091 RepID=UPI00350FE832
MPTKQQLDKAAWEWAEKFEPSELTQQHIETAYRVKLKPCKPNSCRRNCKGNPHCLYGLGERSWLQEIADEDWHEIDDPNSERRPKDSFVGLKNLGATCYVNSFLQVWYHNPAFRKAIYQWKADDDPQEIEAKMKCAETKSESTSYNPSSCIGHLQLIFSFLQFSVRSYIDPSQFINYLGLNATQQQDAQEFSKLFISLLEGKLSYQSNPAVSNIVQEQYSGEYAYITKCRNCLNESTYPSLFYELDLNIKGHKDIYSCLDEFLKEEELDGSNQYYCSYCQNKQNATRAIRLLRLPKLLNLQLLRFVFDRQTGCKKKLNSYIQFCEVLDLSKYVQKPENSVLYDLYAVLIHQGPSAYSGHYVAHIQDRISGAWFKFNDETVERMEGKKLQLGTEENLTDNSTKTNPKAPKLTKGSHASNNAYMLVYRLRDDNYKEYPADTSEEWDLPEYLQEAVVEDNSKFEEWVADLAVMREQNVMTGKARQMEIRSLYEILPVKEGMPYEWINIDWLGKWLTSDTGNILPIDNSQYFCVHGKLHPDQVTKMKCISLEAAEKIYEKYGGGPRFSNLSLCRNCVEMRCKLLRLKAKIQEESKILTNLVKAKISDEENAYWIGKCSLRSWRRMVLDQYEHDDLEKTKTENTSEIFDNNEHLLESGNNDDPSITLQDETDDEVPLGFNEDLLCEHNNLSVDGNTRKLIPEKAWKIFKYYFPFAPEFSRNRDPCSLCLIQEAEDKETRDRNRSLAVEQKSLLQELYLDRNRPNWQKSNIGQKFFIVCHNFIEQWRKFIKEPVRKEPVENVYNSFLLCEHGYLLYSFEDSTNQRLELLWEQEWNILKRHFRIDVEITAQRKEELNGNSILATTPELCHSCYANRLQLEQQQLLDFTNAKIYVRRVSKLEETEINELLDNNCNPDNNDHRNNDSEFVQNVKKKKTGNETEAVTADWQPRRSNRRRKLRGEKEIIVSSNQTLRDLKLEIMKVFSVAPYDQHLTLNGRPLLNNQATLTDLCVFPESLILLRADEPSEETIVMEDYLKAAVPETGFKGTELVKS